MANRSLFYRRREIDFILFDLLCVETLSEREYFSAHDRATFAAVLDTAEKLADEHFAPHAAELDAREPELIDGDVRTPAVLKTVLRAFSDAGFMAATHDQELGGMQLPFCVFQSAFSMISAANVGAAGYLLLSNAAANLLRQFGSTEQQDLYMAPILAGRYFGTMALTEPQAGSSLGDIRTKAVPAADGTYRVIGSKIFISGTEQDISENIVNLVLGRIEGAPPGAKGISLFLVPKFLAGTDGKLGKRNDVRVGGLIHKMGYRATVNTIVNFGDSGECTGFLIGRPNEGLSNMFYMMNEARIVVGVGSAALAYAGYLHAVEHARMRKQGRSATAKADSGQVPIIEHADVKRMLLTQKVYSEGGLVLAIYAAKLVDDVKTSSSAIEKEDCGLLLEFLTPIVKAWNSHFGLEANSLSIQVHGGIGYTTEYAVERLYRDNRLNPIHEGTNGIQANDLLGRKLTLKNGRAFELVCKRMRDTVAGIPNGSDLAGCGAQLAEAIQLLETVSERLAQMLAADREKALANAWLYLELSGHIVVAWLWLMQALTAERLGKTADRPDEIAYLRGKMHACRYFFRWELPRSHRWAQLLTSFEMLPMQMAASDF